jgi:hypothetical protein
MESYIMMLDFYGIKMVSIETGQLERSKNYEKRYKNLLR